MNSFLTSCEMQLDTSTTKTSIPYEDEVTYPMAYGTNPSTLESSYHHGAPSTTTPLVGVGVEVDHNKNTMQYDTTYPPPLPPPPTCMDYNTTFYYNDNTLSSNASNASSSTTTSHTLGTENLLLPSSTTSSTTSSTSLDSSSTGGLVSGGTGLVSGRTGLASLSLDLTGTTIGTTIGTTLGTTSGTTSGTGLALESETSLLPSTPSTGPILLSSKGVLTSSSPISSSSPITTCSPLSSPMTISSPLSSPLSSSFSSSPMASSPKSTCSTSTAGSIYNHINLLQIEPLNDFVCLPEEVSDILIPILTEIGEDKGEITIHVKYKPRPEECGRFETLMNVIGHQLSTCPFSVVVSFIQPPVGNAEYSAFIMFASRESLLKVVHFFLQGDGDLLHNIRMRNELLQEPPNYTCQQEVMFWINSEVPVPLEQDPSNTRTPRLVQSESRFEELCASFYTEDGQVAFATRYDRNNRKGGQKNLRCFPCCRREKHTNSGFCGRSILVRVTIPSEDAQSSDIFSVRERDDGIVSFCRFVSCDEGVHDILTSGPEVAVGDYLNTTSLETFLRKRSLPLAPWIEGVVKESFNEKGLNTAIFEYNGEGMAWHYGWVAPKRQCSKSKRPQHALEVLFFERLGNEIRCLHRMRSDSFAIQSCRRKPGNEVDRDLEPITRSVSPSIVTCQSSQSTTSSPCSSNFSQPCSSNFSSSTSSQVVALASPIRFNPRSPSQDPMDGNILPDEWNAVASTLFSSTWM